MIKYANILFFLCIKMYSVRKNKNEEEEGRKMKKRKSN